MFPASFDYHRAASLDEAVALLGRLDDAKLLAGGHSLLPMMKLRLSQPASLIDIGRLDELRGIDVDDRSVRVGALTTHGELAASAELREVCPLLAEAAGHVGDLQVRHRGTVGGNLAHADPASDLPAVLVALGGTLYLVGPDGERAVAAADFFVALLQTAVGENELLTAVSLPRSPAGTGTAYLKVDHPASGYAVCGAAATVTVDGGRCSGAALAFNGVTATPHAANAVAESLVGGPADAGAISAAVDAHLAITDPLGDLHASGPYRAELARVYGRRALVAAASRAGGG